MTRIAVLDDWQGIARESADWSELSKRAEVVFLRDALAGEDDAAEKLKDFDILLTMRERTAFPASLVRRLPKLKMLGMTGMRAASIDTAALASSGVTVCYTGGGGPGAGTAELTLGLMLAAARGIPAGDAAIKNGRFQDGVPPGFELAGKTVGIVGLGRLGSRVARYCRALDMRVIAWSKNLTAEKAQAAGAALVSKDELLTTADVVTLHLVLSDRTRGIIGAAELQRMKHGAVLVNTSRGSLVDEAALLAELGAGRLIAALDVYDREPLPADHPLRRAPNLVTTPHLGYGTVETFKDFYGQSVENAVAFLDGKPVRVLAAPAKA
ncbi:MAG: D-2-hydroxyacid dehydrogenase family protein [Rhodospirillales bacterium]